VLCKTPYVRCWKFPPSPILVFKKKARSAAAGLMGMQILISICFALRGGPYNRASTATNH